MRCKFHVNLVVLRVTYNSLVPTQIVSNYSAVKFSQRVTFSRIVFEILRRYCLYFNQSILYFLAKQSSRFINNFYDKAIYQIVVIRRMCILEFRVTVTDREHCSVSK